MMKVLKVYAIVESVREDLKNPDLNHILTDFILYRSILLLFTISFGSASIRPLKSV